MPASLRTTSTRVIPAIRDRLRSLRTRVIGLLILALLPVFGLMVFTASESRRQAMQETQDNTLRLTELAAANQRQLIDGARDILIPLAQIPAIQSQDRAACLFFLSNVLMQHPLYANFGAADASGNIYCMTLPQRMPMSIAQQAYFQQSMASHDFALSEYQISPTNSQAIITLGYPVLGSMGHPQGIVFASLDLRWLGPFMSAAPLPAGSTLRAIDPHGIILASYPEGEIEIGRTMPEASVSHTVLSEKAGLVEGRDANGTSRLYAFTPLHAGADSDVYIIISIPTDVAFAESNRILVRNLIALTAGTLLALGIAWLGTQFFFLRQVNTLVSTTERLGAGDLSARLDWGPGQGELGQLAHAFDDMAATLQRRELEQREAEAQIRQQERIRADLLHQVIGAQEDERMRIARELHDETSQSLTAILVGLDTINIATQSDISRIEGHVRDLKSITEDMLANIHRLIADLRPSLLDDIGLVAAIEWYGEQRLKPYGLSFRLLQHTLPRRLPPPVETVVFRIVQEGLTNIVRHARANSVTVRLLQDQAEVTLEIRDDGVGFDPQLLEAPEAGGRGLGLRGMRERATILGGSLEIESAAGRGTTVRIRFPTYREEESLVHDPTAIGG
jgi:signal transduction histidine kinase